MADSPTPNQGTGPLQSSAWQLFKNRNWQPYTSTPSGAQVSADLNNTPPGQGSVTVGSPFSNFTHWLPYMVLMGGVLLMVSRSPKYAPLGVAFAGVIAGGYLLINYNGVTTGFNQTFTTALPAA